MSGIPLPQHKKGSFNHASISLFPVMPIRPGWARQSDVLPGDALHIPGRAPHRSLADTYDLFCLNIYLLPDTYEIGGLLSALRFLYRKWKRRSRAIAAPLRNGLRPGGRPLPPAILSRIRPCSRAEAERGSPAGSKKSTACLRKHFRF